MSTGLAEKVEHAWFPKTTCDARCVGGGESGSAARVAIRSMWRIAATVLMLLALPLITVPVPGRSRLQRRYCRLVLRCLGVRINQSGNPVRNLPGVLVVSNHTSWVDVFAIGAVVPGSFVARADLTDWPGIGVAVRMMGVIPIERRSLRQLPPVVDGRRNLTWQSWSVPGVFNADTGSIRFKQNLANGWLWTTSYGAQRLKTDDRLAYAFGCSAESAYDRFCSNGSFDLYDWRSDNERRRVNALQTEVAGQAQFAGLRHDLTLGLMRYRSDLLTQPYAYNWAGVGSVFTAFTSSAAPEAVYAGTNRSEYATELSLRDRITLGARNTLWAGLRHSRIDRASVGTDGSSPLQVQNSFTTPWLALSHALQAGAIVYGSYGQGVELDAAPNLPIYTNAGQALAALRSKQMEVGLKQSQGPVRWQAAWFDITRPQAADACDANGLCTRQTDGETRNRGLELSGAYSQGPWLLHASSAWIDSKRQNATLDPSVNGQRGLNVPNVVLRALAQYRWRELPGLRTSLRVSHEGQRQVLEDGSLPLPAWTTLDLAAHYDTRVQGLRTEWTLAIDNLTDKHYWRESPKQFGHYYLYPGAPRTARITVRTRF